MDKIDIRDLIVRELKANTFGTTDQTGNELRVVEDCDFVDIAERIVENLPIYGVSSSLILNIKSFGEFIDKLCLKDYNKRNKQYKYKDNWYGFTELKKIYKREFLN